MQHLFNLSRVKQPVSKYFMREICEEALLELEILEKLVTDLE